LAICETGMFIGGIILRKTDSFLSGE